MINPKDRYNSEAAKNRERVRYGRRVITTVLILCEIGDAFSSSKDRLKASEFIDQLYQTPNTTVFDVDANLLQQGIRLYGSRPDKQWGLTDCISFIVMEREGIALAATADHHFVQAGFTALMLV